jgi:putative SOS response-associated peptidase YedK
MCGRYTLRFTAATKVPGLDCALPEMKARYNLTPSQDGIIVRLNEAGEMYASIATWGFCPGWMKDASKAQANARGETVADKPMFRSAFRKTRCLVVIDSFYEWDRSVKPTQPYSIQRMGGAPLACAGIWTTRTREDGTEETNYAVITTGPNAEMESIHDRMPVILDEKDYRTWLDPKTDPESLKKLMIPCPDGTLEAHPVSRAVNRPQNDSPDLLRPLG